MSSKRALALLRKAQQINGEDHGQKSIINSHPSRPRPPQLPVRSHRDQLMDRFLKDSINEAVKNRKENKDQLRKNACAHSAEHIAHKRKLFQEVTNPKILPKKQILSPNPCNEMPKKPRLRFGITNHSIGGYASYCKKCKKWSSLTTGTFFEKTQVQFEQFFLLLFLWASHISVRGVVQITGFTKVMIVQYFRYFRDVCSWKLLDMEPLQLGGEGHVIEIDESAITRRKYNRGKRVKTSWVLGMYDKTTQQGIVLYVPQRNKSTMVPLIRKHVKTGSIIWTDQWKAYDSLSQYGYIHKTVNHSKEFKSKTGVCTNGVEGFWRTMKMYIRSKNVLQSKFLYEYIDEFMWSQIFGKSAVDKFQMMLTHIKERYPL